MANQDDFMGRIKNNWRQRGTERTTFRAELRIIPRWLCWLLGALYFVALAAVSGVAVFQPGDLLQPLVDEPLALRLLAMYGIATAVAIPVAAFILLFGYINRDAKRRGMSPAIWTLVALFVPYLVGVLVYFIVREPLPFDCPQCGRTVSGQFNFCPNCQFNLRPNCPQCRREVRPGDRFCPHCGFALGAATPSTPTPASAQVV
jgi:Double zinc ribbon